jgi:hypothetical protein
MQRDRLPYFILPVAALIAVLPLILQGCSCGHDFDFHVLNWLEAAQQFRHGNLHPHWAVTPAYNAGEPRFIFYPPLSWTIGAILGLLFQWAHTWIWTPILYTWLALTASGFTLYRLARNFASPAAALLAASFYTTNPYMLFTAYERTAYGELLAAAWIPLLLAAILRNRVTIPRIAIPVALLWLTNAPAAVMSCYALALLTLIRLATNSTSPSSAIKPDTPSPTAPDTPSSTNPGAPSSRGLIALRWASRASATAPAHAQATTAPSQSPLHLALTTTAGTALGLGLAAFYLIPAAYERRYVQIAMAILPGMRIQDNFLFHHTGTTPDALLHDTVLHTTSLIALILITLTAITLLLIPITTPGAPSSRGFIALRWASRKARPSSSPSPQPQAPHSSNQQRLLLPLSALTIVIALLLTPISTPIWNHAPELAFLQFPWRLLAILAATLSLTLALALTRTRLKPTQTALIALAAAATLTYPSYHLFHQPCDEEDTVPALVTLFHSNTGAEPTDEYTPLTADNDSLAPSNPPYWLSPDPTAPAPPNSLPGPAPHSLTLNSSSPQFLILNLRDYPSWHINLNNAPTQQLPNARPDGLIALPIPTGTSHILITYKPLTDQTLGITITLLSAIILITLIPRKRRAPTTNN